MALYDPSCLIENHAHSAVQTELLMGPMIVYMAVQRVQQPRITYRSLTEDECYCLTCARHWLLKGMGEDARIALIYVPPQNTPMTDSESKYSPFALCAALCAQIFPALYICSWQENIGWSRPHKQFNPRLDDFKSQTYGDQKSGKIKIK